MKETIDQAKDFKHLLKHDRRFWAIGGFVVVVVVIMLATDTWKPKKSKKEKIIPEKVVEENVQPISSEMISAIKKNMEDRKKVDEELTAEINRMKNNYESDKKEINESLRGLSEKVNNTTSQLNDLIDQVGEKKPHSVP